MRANEKANQHKHRDRYAIAFGAVKELKKIMIREENVAQIGIYCANAPIYSIRCGCVHGIVLVLAFHGMILLSLPQPKPFPNDKPLMLTILDFHTQTKTQRQYGNKIL